MILIPIPIRIRPPTGAMEHGILRPMNMPVPNPAMVRADEMAAMRTVGIAMVSQLLPICIKANWKPLRHGIYACGYGQCQDDFIT